MNWTTIQNQADRLFERAIRETTCKVGGIEYVLRFDRPHGVYRVFDPSGANIVSFNTRKVTEAKRWLREYYG